MLPTVANRSGFQYRATAIGSSPHHTGGFEPTWPTTIGNCNTVVDGDITWTCYAEDGEFYISSGPWFDANGAVAAANVWSVAKTVALGQLMLPTVANRSGFQYRATAIGSSPHTGGFEPRWPTTIGHTVLEGDITWTCYAEEGGPISSRLGNSPKSWKYIYVEANQAFSEFTGGLDMILGGAAGFAMTPTSLVNFGPSSGVLVPFEIASQVSFVEGFIGRPVKLRMGIQSEPYVGFTKYSGNTRSSSFYVAGHSELRDFWDQSLKRWSRQVFQPQYGQNYYKIFSYTESDGKGGPQPGAVCWPTVWVGGVIGTEKRLTALPAQANAPYAPDFTDSCVSSHGSYQENDLVWNAAKSGRPQMPLVWRSKAKGGKYLNTWKESVTYDEGILISPDDPATANGPIYRAMTAGVASTCKPAFADTPGQRYTDGGVLWEWWGNIGSSPPTTIDDSIWEPVISELPTMLTKSVAGSSNVKFTEDEGGHARFKFTGELTGNITVAVPAGPAIGWCRSFWNATTGAFTLTVANTVGGTGVVVVAMTVAVLFSDGTTVMATV